MTDFRALCAEPLAQKAYVAFVQICKGGSDDAGTYEADEAIVRRALKRLDELEGAALAQPEPEGPTDGELLQVFDTACLSEGGMVDEIHLRGLRAVLARWGEPMTDYKQLCAEMVNELNGYKVAHPNHSTELIARARAALAKPEPEGPTDDELRELWQESWDTREEHGAFQFARAVLARWGRPTPQPVPVSERLPGHIEQALIKAECALSDIAEGEAEESEGDPLEWAEKRAADALARIRPVMWQHQIQTSEWPPKPAHALPLPLQ